MIKFFPIDRDKKLSVKEQIVQHYGGKYSFDKGQGVEDIGRNGSVYYVAYRFVSPHDNYKQEIQCLVVETQLVEDMIYIRERWEEFGPKLYDCPKRILKKLTRPKSDVSSEWRKKCNAKREEEKQKRKERKHYQTIIRKGATIVFSKPVSFSDGKRYSRMKVTSVVRNRVKGLHLQMNFKNLVQDLREGRIKVNN